MQLIRVWLKKSIIEDPRWSCKEVSNRGTPDTSVERRFNGIKISDDNGRFYFFHDEPFLFHNGSVDEIDEFVEEVTAIDKNACFVAVRETGFYKWRTAIAELRLEGESTGNGQKIFSLAIRAGNLKDLIVLFHLIQAGTLRPETSFEGKQEGRSVAELNEQLTATEEKIKAIQIFVSTLELGHWSLCSRKRVIAGLREIIFGDSNVATKAR